MDTRHGAVNCRWATPTLYLPQPLWLHAWDSPWSCVRGGMMRVLRTSDTCTGCPRWEPRPLALPLEAGRDAQGARDLA